MSMQPSRSAAEQPIDLSKLAHAAGALPTHDDRGRASLRSPAGELTVATADGHTSCDLLFVDETLRVTSRHLEATPAATVLLGASLHELERALTEGDPRTRPARLATWASVLEDFPYDDLRRGAPRRREMLRALPPAIAVGTPLHVAVDDPLHPLSLRHDCPAAAVDKVDGGGVVLRTGSASIEWTRRADGAAEGHLQHARTGSPRVWRFELEADGVLFLVAAQTALDDLATAGLLGGMTIGRAALAGLTAEIAEIQNAVVRQRLSAPQGYVELAERLDHTRALTVQAPSRQLHAAARMALSRWWARGGQAELEERVGLDALEHVTGGRVAAVGDEHVLELPQGRLVVADEGDLGVGRCSFVGADGLLSHHASLAVAEPRLAWAAWALGGLHELEGRAARALRGFLATTLAVRSPFGAHEARAVLDALRDHGESDQRTAIRSLLSRAPRRRGTPPRRQH